MGIFYRVPVYAMDGKWLGILGRMGLGYGRLSSWLLGLGLGTVSMGQGGHHWY